MLEEHGLEQLKKGLFEGAYDFAIMNLPVDEVDFDVIPLLPDELVLAVPNRLLHLIEGNLGERKIDLKACKKLPFVVVGKKQEMRKLFERIFAKEEIEPEIFVEVTGITTAREMVRKGVAATLIPKQFLQNEIRNGDVTLFEISYNEYVRQPAIVLRRGQYVSKYAEFAIELLKKIK